MEVREGKGTPRPRRPPTLAPNREPTSEPTPPAPLASSSYRRTVRPGGGDARSRVVDADATAFAVAGVLSSSLPRSDPRSDVVAVAVAIAAAPVVVAVPSPADADSGIGGTEPNVLADVDAYAYGIISGTLPRSDGSILDVIYVLPISDVVDAVRVGV